MEKKIPFDTRALRNKKNVLKWGFTTGSRSLSLAAVLDDVLHTHTHTKASKVLREREREKKKKHDRWRVETIQSPPPSCPAMAWLSRSLPD